MAGAAAAAAELAARHSNAPPLRPHPGKARRVAKNTVIVSVLGDTKDLQRNLSGGVSALGTFAKRAAAVTAVVAAGVTALGIKATKSASELEQNLGAMASVFKDSNGQMLKWAQGAASAVGLAKSEYAGLATVLGAQLKNMGVSQDQLGDQTNKLIGLGSDLAAQFGGSTSDAVSALSSLLRGERDPIERYGVSINEAAVKAKMAEMGLAGLTGEAEKNAKLSATLALLYAQTADAQGAFSRESTTLAGAQQRLAAGTENLYATLGTALLPAVTAVTAGIGGLVNKLQESQWFQTFTANLTGASNTFADFVFGILNGTQSIDFGQLFGGMVQGITQGVMKAAAWISAGGLTPIFATISNARDGFLGAAIELFKALGQALPVILPEIITAIVTLLDQLVSFVLESIPILLDAAVQLFTALVQAIPVIVPQLVTALVDIVTQIVPTIVGLIPVILDGAIQLFTALIEALPIILPELIAGIIGLIPVLIVTIIGLIPQLLNAAVQLFTSLITAIPMILPNLLLKLVEMAPQLIQTIIGMVPQLLNSGKQLFMSLVQAIPTIASKLGPEIMNLGPKMFAAVQSLIPQMLSAGGDLVRGLANGLRNGASAVVSNLLGIARNAIREFKNFLGIHSPSRVFEQFGVFIDQGLAGGIRRSIGVVKDAVGGLNEAVQGTFTATLDGGSATVTPPPASGGESVIRHVYEITVHAVAGGVETGRAIIEAIENYERVTGGRPA